MKEILLKVIFMVKESGNQIKVIFMKAIILIILNTDLVLIDGKMESST